MEHEIKELKHYQNWVDTTCTPRVDFLGLTYASLGLAGETGEVIECVKKLVRDERLPNDNDKQYLKLELGDVLWYVTRMANLLDLSLTEIMLANVEKLENRKKYGK